MTTSSPPDVIDVIPVLKPEPVDDPPSLSARLRAAIVRQRWVLLAVLLLLVAAVFTWRATRPRPLVLLGQVEAQEINIVAPGAGVLTRLLVQPGQQIEAGAPLFEVDAGATSAGAAVAAAEAASAAAAAAAASAAAQVAANAASAAAAARTAAAAAQQVTVPANTAEVVQARAELERSRIDAARFERSAELAYGAYQRAVGLYEDSMIESSARDAAQAQWNAADAQVRAARARHEQVRRRVAEVLAAAPQISVPVAGGAASATPAAVATPAPARALSVAAAAGSAGAPGRQTLRAPLGGEVDRIGVTAGTRVLAGQWLASLVNLSDVWVVAVVREDVLPSFAFGTLHTVEVPVLSARLELRVDSVTQLPDFATWRSVGGAELRSFEVRLRSDAALPGLRPGMAVVFAPR